MTVGTRSGHIRQSVHIALAVAISAALTREAGAQRLEASRFGKVPHADTARVVLAQRAARPSLAPFVICGAVVGGLMGYSRMKDDNSDGGFFPKEFTIVIGAGAGAFVGALIGVIVVSGPRFPRPPRQFPANPS